MLACVSSGETEDVVHADVDAVAAYALDGAANVLVAEAALLDTVADVAATGFDTEAEPGEPRPPQLLEKRVVDRVDPRVRPDVEVVATLDQQVADAKDVALVQHEHLGRGSINYAYLLAQPPGRHRALAGSGSQRPMLPCRSMTLTLKAKVRGGHLIVEETVDLPEGAEVELAVVDPGDDLDDAERERLHVALLEAQSELDAGSGVPASEALEELRGRRKR